MRVIVFVICMFVCRIQLRRIQKTKLLDERLTKIGTVTCLLLPALLFFPIPLVLYFPILLVHHIFVSSLSKIFEHMKLAKAQLVCLSAITKIILYMQIGSSLRSALDKLVQNERDHYWKIQWQQIAEIVAFSPQELSFKSQFLRRFAKDLVCADQLSFQQRDQLIEIRALYRKESDFRRRSGQALLQLRMQAIILFGLHLAVTAFMIHQFGWLKHQIVFVSSFILMLSGLIVLLKMGKSKSWKT